MDRYPAIGKLPQCRRLHAWREKDSDLNVALEPPVTTHQTRYLREGSVILIAERGLSDTVQFSSITENQDHNCST